MRADRRWRFEAETAPRRTLPGIRARSALAAVLVVGIALGVAGVVLFVVLQHSLLNGIDDQNTGRAYDMADRFQVVGADTLQSQLDGNRRDDQIIQVVRNRDNRVVVDAGSGPAPFSDLRADPGQVVKERAGPRKIFDSGRPYLVTIRGAEQGDDSYSVIVATSFQPQREVIDTLVKAYAIGAPLLLLVVGIASWALASRALGPVEAIRTRVAGIDPRDLDDRVPIPPTRDEIARLAITMNKMLDRLQASQQAQRQFVADASHELRSPLATLAATLEVVAADPTGRAWRDLLPVMSDETGRMSVLVENLLLLAKVDDRGLVLDVEDVDLDDLIEEEARRLRASTDLVVTTSIAPTRVAGDLVRLGQAIRNLVDNASRHATSRVHLGVSAAPGAAVVTVTDDGPGVPPGEREHVFERFVRLEDARDRSSGGSGLGLPIVREVVRGHGGRVEITDPEQGPGCRVVVLLPLQVEEPEPPEAVVVEDGAPVAGEPVRVAEEPVRDEHLHDELLDDGPRRAPLPDPLASGPRQPPSASSR